MGLEEGGSGSNQNWWWGLGPELSDISAQTDIYIAILFLLLKARTYESILSRLLRNRERVIIFFSFASILFPLPPLLCINVYFE